MPLFFLRLPAFLAMLGCLLAMASAPVSAQTLDAVRERGFLICGATNPLPGFAQKDAEGRWSGFDVDLCRAIAAAVFGDPDLIEFRSLRGETRFAPLQTEAVDVLTRNGPWTERRDTIYGASFVGTAFFDGQAFLVPQSLGLVSAFELDNVSICVIDGGDDLERIQEFFFANQATYTEVPYEDIDDLALAYRTGLCQIISAPGRQLQAIRRALPDPNAHRILPERISKDLLGPVVRSGDQQWFNIVKWTLFALINAEEVGITGLNTESLAASHTPVIRRILGVEGDFGTPLGLEPTFMADAIRAVGNYSELYDRHFGPQTGAALLRGQNSLWSNGGLLYAPPVR
ncbi:amino acid ABC transporter substrate-binding protein [Devosia sp. J2-20]|uniref:amino acid ABC transporter substrate-binding protein n=1 Tax=Devosia TaxID=46913 RepID=UPI0022AEA50A|nr:MULTISPECIES: amino acid ABC transporter substrate-binding protein [Devosia]MCZ4346283.1 amino acid ABC transporter substrate-binding protein [Devosia neptuniae]WDQ98222.1 amino acid ABC transporter substrate-binding protein [Devosia sp. J2-20]